jgi:hypothetical protein
MENTLGYIASGLSSIALATFYLCRETSRKCTQAHRTIKDEFAWAYKEYGNAIPASDVDETNFRVAVNRIYDLNWRMRRLAAVEIQSKRLAKIAIAGLCAAIAFVVIDYLLPDSYTSLKTTLGLIVPALLAVLQLVFLYFAYTGEQLIDQLTSVVGKL